LPGTVGLITDREPGGEFWASSPALNRYPADPAGKVKIHG